MNGNNWIEVVFSGGLTVAILAGLACGLIKEVRMMHSNKTEQ